MINFENAEKEFLKYVNKFDLKDEATNRKKWHSFRVMENSEILAQKLKLNQEEAEVAKLIGLLHDIGRFEQYEKAKKFLNEEKFDHGNYGEFLLKQNNYIEKYISDKKYIPIILKAVKNHNKYKIEEELTEKEEMFCKLIRDADKLDILYETVCIYWKSEKEVKNIENSKISPKIKEQLKKQEEIKRQGNEKFDSADHLLIILSFIYDINFKETFEIIENQQYINKMLRRFDFKDKETKEKMKEIEKEIEQYINSNIIS